MRTTESERRDWAVIALILLFGLFLILLAGSCALRFTPRWELDTNVQSALDPNSDFLTNKPVGFIEPVDPAILTNPAWMNAILTPGASFSTITQPSTEASVPAVTSTFSTLVTTQTTIPTTTAFATSTVLVLASPTNTLVYFLPPSASPRPNRVSTSASTDTATPTSTASAAPSLTSTPITPTATTPSTPDVTEPDFGAADGNTIMLGNGMWIEFDLTGFFLDGNSTWDLVYYEKEETSAAGKIHLGTVLIEVYDETTAAWYTIYNWGDGTVDGNASYNNGNSEPDGFPVDQNLLYGVPPLNTGIAIDLDVPAIGQGGASGDSITKIRITSLSNNDCDIDSLEMLR